MAKTYEDGAYKGGLVMLRFLEDRLNKTLKHHAYEYNSAAVACAESRTEQTINRFAIAKTKKELYEAVINDLQTETAIRRDFESWLEAQPAMKSLYNGE